MNIGKNRRPCCTVIPLTLLCWWIFLIYPLKVSAEAAPKQEKYYSIQEFRSLDGIISLNSSEKEEHTWWATGKAINPEQYSKTILRKRSHTEELVGDGWIPVTVPGNLNNYKEFPASVTEAWYRKLFMLPPDLDTPVAIRLGEITDSDKTYLNGVLIGESGEWNSQLPQVYDKHRIYFLPDQILRKGELNVLLVRVKRYFPQETGIYKNTTSIGPAKQILGEFYFENYSQLIIFMMYLTAAVYFLFLFINRRKEKEYLFFFLSIFMLVVYQFLRTQFKHELGLDFFFFKRIEYLVCLMVVPLFLYFVRFYYDLPRNGFVKWWDRVLLLPVIGLCVCMVFVLLVDSVVSWDLMFRSVVDIILWPILILNGLGILVYRMIRKDRDSFFMMIGFLFGLSGLFVDILSNRLVLNLPRISTYGFIIFIMTMAIILANRYVQLQKEVEAKNIKLERKLGYQDLKLEGLNIDKITEELSVLMKEKKLFIDENLKLGDLANELSITSHQLSRLLNGHYNMNFNEFVNSYRVEEAKSKLISDKEKTILAIAFDVGFNTKATFNSQFLKFTKMTPSRYRKRYL